MSGKGGKSKKPEGQLNVSAEWSLVVLRDSVGILVSADGRMVWRSACGRWLCSLCGTRSRSRKAATRTTALNSAPRCVCPPSVSPLGLGLQHLARASSRLTPPPRVLSARPRCQRRRGRSCHCGGIRDQASSDCVHGSCTRDGVHAPGRARHGD